MDNGNALSYQVFVEKPILIAVIPISMASSDLQKILVSMPRKIAPEGKRLEMDYGEIHQELLC